MNKFNRKVSTHYQIVCLYSVNICYDIFVSNDFFDFFLFFLLECVQFQSYQNILNYYQSHTKLPNEFLLIYTHQDLLHTPHPLFWVNYS